MAEKIIKTILKINKNTEEQLTNFNPVLKNGEVVLSTIAPSSPEEPEIVLMRIGDGNSNYNSLPWLSALAADVYDWAKAESKPIYSANEINFADGENFQQKYDKGELKGEKGDKGDPANNFAFEIIDGNLVMTSSSQSELDNFSIDSSGNLIMTISGGN